MSENVEKLIETLKGIVDRNSTNYLLAEPYQVYLALIRTNECDKKTADAVLHLLVSGLLAEIKSGIDPDTMSKRIQDVCCLNGKMSERLTEIFSTLYSDNNREVWESRNQEGLEQFMHEQFVCEWDGYAVWDAGTCTMDCSYYAAISLMPQEKILEDQELSSLIRKNPFMKKEEILELFEKRLCAYLDSELEDYCTADDYYPPCVEDFDAEYYVSEWCGEHGFSFISCEGSGCSGDFEPKYRRYH